MSERCKTIIIAEIGECFNGDMETARRLIFEAGTAGCDIAKFQTLDYENISDDDPERDWFRKIALDPERMSALIGFGREAGIEVLFTPENVKTARWIADIGLKAVKIASSTLADVELAAFVKESFDVVFMSTGMATMDEVDAAVKTLSSVPSLYVMHCVSEYPTGPLLEQRGLKALSACDVRLNMMKMIMLKYPHLKVGYSDHTDGILAPVAAVAAGACVIEKHVTLDRKTPVESFKQGGEYMGTDHVLSIEPHELREMVHMIREVETMFGPCRWERSEGENILRDFLRGRFAS